LRSTHRMPIHVVAERGSGRHKRAAAGLCGHDLGGPCTTCRPARRALELGGWARRVRSEAATEPGATRPRAAGGDGEHETRAGPERRSARHSQAARATESRPEARRDSLRRRSRGRRARRGGGGAVDRRVSLMVSAASWGGLPTSIVTWAEARVTASLDGRNTSLVATITTCRGIERCWQRGGRRR